MTQNNNKIGLFIPKFEIVKAIQLQQLQQFEDEKTGEKFYGQVGDWKVWDMEGNCFLLTYYQFINRYVPYNDTAFEQYRNKLEILHNRNKYNKYFKEEYYKLKKKQQEQK